LGLLKSFVELFAVLALILKCEEMVLGFATKVMQEVSAYHPFEFLQALFVELMI